VLGIVLGWAYLTRYAALSLLATMMAALLILHEGWRKRLRIETTEIVIEPSGPSARVRVESGAQVQEIGVVQQGDPDIARALVQGVNAKRKRLIVRLPRSDVLLKQLTFPAGAEENLRQVLGYEMDRITPFPSTAVYYDFRVRERIARQDKIRVELAVVLRKVADPWLEDLSQAGVVPNVVDAEELWTGVNLLPPERRRQRKSGVSLVGSVLWFLVLAALGVALAVPLWQKRQIALELSQQVARIRPVAEQVAKLREDLAQAERSSRFLWDRRRNAVFAIDVLAEVTRLVPDNTWVQQIEFRNGEVQLRGESGDAAALIQRFENSRLFSSIGFRSPVVQQQSTGKERFHLAARVTVGGKQ